MGNIYRITEEGTFDLQNPGRPLSAGEQARVMMGYWIGIPEKARPRDILDQLELIELAEGRNSAEYERQKVLRQMGDKIELEQDAEARRRMIALRDELTRTGGVAA